MKSTKCLTVTNPPVIFRLCLCILGFFVILVLANTLFAPPPHTAMYVCVTIFVFIPGTIAALWAKMFRIQVEGRTISVRKCLGLVNFRFSVSDIAGVEWKTTATQFGRSEKVLVTTSDGKKVSIETLMVHSEEMIRFIEENVDEMKIKRICVHPGRT